VARILAFVFAAVLLSAPTWGDGNVSAQTSRPRTAHIPDPRVGPHAADEARQAATAQPLAPATTTPVPLGMHGGGPMGAPIINAGSPSPFHREVFGFAPYWSLSQYATWDYRLLSTLVYFGITLDDNGNIDTSAPGYNQFNSQDFVNMVDLAHAAGDRVVVVIKNFHQDGVNRIVTDPALSQVAINNAISLIQSKRLDGVNVDFEATTADAPYIYIQSGMTTFMGKISQAVHQQWPNAEVSIDTYTGSASWDGGVFKIGDLAPNVDAFFIMAYDMVFENQPGVAGANAPMTHFTFNDSDAVAQYLSKAPASKIILGVPYYGYKWNTAGNGPNSPTTGGATADTYGNIVSELQCSMQYMQTGWDSYAQSPWISWYSPASNDPCGGNNGSWREMYYDSAWSLGLKYDLVNQNGLRGAGMWALGYDGGATELWNEIAEKLTTVTAWETLGGSTWSDTRSASWGAGRLDVVTRNGYWGVSHKSWDGTQWSGWDNLGGYLLTGPTAVSGTSGRVDVFATAGDTAVWHKAYVNGAWQGWESLGGNVGTGPSSSSWGVNRLDVFVVGVDHAVYHKFWDGTSWHPWEKVGGYVASDPASVSWGPNRLDIVVRGTDNRLYHKAWDSNGWRPWESLGGDLISNPAIASCSPGHLDVFSVGADRALWRRGWNGTSWTPWVNQGGQWAGGPSAVCQAAGTVIDVFERGQDMAAWHTTVNAT